ncbi:DNA helicase MCM8-like isoform X2 [Anopheles funestus]|uniref:DNA helicase MCM8-like isoform X2 n=1 Tax=Anopheles funestus TaxID=62324 RepID=UPI0020C5D020|nr:DNA helicase MCM8-like isoform X2 [Anopheles funestus]
MLIFTMDKQNIFRTPFSDRECNSTGVFSQLQNGHYSSQGSSLLTGFNATSNHAAHVSSDRIGWQLYFPGEGNFKAFQIYAFTTTISLLTFADLCSLRTITKHVRCLEQHYTDFVGNYSPSEVERCRSFEFKLQLAETDLFLKNSWPNFEGDLKECPEYTIACIGLAMYRFVAAQRKHTHGPPTPERGLPKICPRINYFGPEISIGTIDSRYADRLITIRGIITRISQQYDNATWRTYKCKHCNDTIVLSQLGEFYTCSNCKVGGGIEFINTSVWNRTDTHRNFTIQGTILHSRSSNALDVLVPDGSGSKLFPGADVSVTGILKTISTEKHATHMFLQTVCMRTNSSKPNDVDVEPTFNAIDLQAIREIQSEPFPFQLMVQSICPYVKGMETIKAGLLLALFSTTCDTHVLLAGTECEMARQLIECFVSASPKGILINDSSQTLDLAVKRFHAGQEDPAVLANLGLCGKEIDKLHALEKILSGGVTSTKHYSASYNQEVPARINLLATVCPNQGMFEVSKPFLDHFNIPRAFVERFALVFQMEDTFDPGEELICYNGVRLHFEKPSTTKCSVEIPLVRKLKLISGDHFDPLPIELMRKYIDYARQHCNPEFTDESTKLLEGFFSQMYSMPQWLNMTNGMKIAQIQNMVRARARIDLSAEITTEHVMDTIRIVSRSWYDKYDTDDRNPSVKLPAKQRTTKTATVRKFLDVLRNQSVELNKKLFTLNDLRKLINEVGVPGVEDEIVERLNMQGYLLKKSEGLYELLV